MHGAVWRLVACRLLLLALPLSPLCGFIGGAAFGGARTFEVVGRAHEVIVTIL